MLQPRRLRSLRLKVGSQPNSRLSVRLFTLIDLLQFIFLRTRRPRLVRRLTFIIFLPCLYFTVAKKQTKKGSGKDKVPEPDRELEESHSSQLKAVLERIPLFLLLITSSDDADAEKETESPDEAPAKYSCKIYSCYNYSLLTQCTAKPLAKTKRKSDILSDKAPAGTSQIGGLLHMHLLTNPQMKQRTLQRSNKYCSLLETAFVL